VRHVPAQSRHDSSVCACLVESPALSFHFGLSPGFGLCLFFISCFYFSCFYLNALAFIFSVTRSFSLPEFSFFSPLGHVSPCSHGQYSAVVLRRSAQSRSSRFGRAALFCVAWVCADASVIRSCTWGGFALPYPRPSPLHVRGVQERFISQSLTLLLLGRTGW